MDGFQLKQARAARSKAARTALAGAVALRDALATAKDRGARSDQVDRLRRAALDALMADVSSARRADAARLEIEIATVRANFRKEYDRHRAEREVEIRTAELRHKAMSEREVRAEAAAILDGSRTGQDPRILDSFSAALKAVDPKLHETLRGKLVQGRYDDPAVTTGIGKQLFDDLEHANKTHGGGISLRDEKGRRFVISITDLLDALEVENGHGEI
jgi:hypothetical protein